MKFNKICFLVLLLLCCTQQTSGIFWKFFGLMPTIKDQTIIKQRNEELQDQFNIAKKILGLYHANVALVISDDNNPVLKGDYAGQCLMDKVVINADTYDKYLSKYQKCMATKMFQYFLSHELIHYKHAHLLKRILWLMKMTDRPINLNDKNFVKNVQEVALALHGNGILNESQLPLYSYFMQSHERQADIYASVDANGNVRADVVEAGLFLAEWHSSASRSLQQPSRSDKLRYFSFLKELQISSKKLMRRDAACMILCHDAEPACIRFIDSCIAASEMKPKKPVYSMRCFLPDQVSFIY